MNDGICSWDDDNKETNHQAGLTRLKLMDILLLNSDKRSFIRKIKTKNY